jgi:tRNA U34 2-thiouridine synthase MnmA/TrmU
MKKVKALVLFSGGLDSILAAELLRRQGIEVLALCFKSYFFDDKQAKQIANSINLPLRVIDFSKDHLGLVKNPLHGFGRGANPCIDCHALMLKKTKEIMKKEKFDFIATGEVLGERPMSQNKQSLQIILKESGLQGYLLRPLSAKLFEPTIPEEKGLVNREKLLDISGRSRKKQMKLAKEWKIKEYPTPSGGCLLTDPIFGNKLKDLIKKHSDFNSNDIELLKIGRHFWDKDIKIIIGRNERENKMLKKLAQKGDIFIEMSNYPGPLAILRSYFGLISDNSIEEAKKLIIKYSNKAGKDPNFKIDKI